MREGMKDGVDAGVDKSGGEHGTGSCACNGPAQGVQVTEDG